MRQLFKTLHDELCQGHDAVIATIVASSGSTPRGAGARMLVTEKGRLYGTIGGGALEYKSESLAKDVLHARNSKTEYFTLRRSDVEDLGMVCGGDVTVYFHYISACDSKIISLTENIEEIYQQGESSWLITDITKGKNGNLTVFSKKHGALGATIPEEIIPFLESRPKLHQVCGNTFYSEKLLYPGKVFIFGGGHVAQELVPALTRVGFRCIVIEDRPEFSRSELFEGVEETRLIPTDHINTLLDEITSDDLICIMTRGHKDDFEVQRVMLKSNAYYIGCIGSRSKIAKVNAMLKDCGYTEQDIARITKPIGLDIKSETPAEIAVSITAQLILARAEHIVGR